MKKKIHIISNVSVFKMEIVFLVSRSISSPVYFLDKYVESCTQPYDRLQNFLCLNLAFIFVSNNGKNC